MDNHPETVAIESDVEGHDGYVEINKAEYDPKKHKLYKGDAAEQPAPPEVTTAQAIPAADQAAAQGAQGTGWGGAAPAADQAASGPENGTGEGTGAAPAGGEGGTDGPAT